jgi:hypothetical protein
VITHTISVPGQPSAVAVADGGVWTLNAATSTVSHIDDKTSNIAETIPLGAGSGGGQLASGAGSIRQICGESLQAASRVDSRTVAKREGLSIAVDIRGSRGRYSNLNFGTITGRSRFIAAELSLKFDQLEQPWRHVYTCHYFNANGQVIGRASCNVVIQPGETSRQTWVSWGSADGGWWRRRTYLVECDVDQRAVGSRYFAVQRR